MSWINDITKQFIIQTGDKIKYYPLLLQNYNKTNEYNGQKFEIVSKSGSSFIRQLPKGRTLDLEFAFTGENNKQLSAAFEQSARDRRSWTVQHPFYGKIECQPLSLKINDTPLDSSIVSCSLIETNKKQTGKVTQQAIDLLGERRNTLAANSINSTLSANAKTATNTAKCAATAIQLSKFALSVVKGADAVQSVKKYSNVAINQINNGFGASISFFACVQKILDAPALVATDIGTKFDTYKSINKQLVDEINNITSPDYFTRLLHCFVGCCSVSSMCETLINEKTTGLETKKGVLLYINQLEAEYNKIIDSVYSIESEEFIPDMQMLIALNTLVNETMLLMFDVLYLAKQERTYITTQNTNAILLAHRLLGAATDENINMIKQTNSIGLDEIIEIKQGREITYFA